MSTSIERRQKEREQRREERRLRVSSVLPSSSPSRPTAAGTMGLAKRLYVRNIPLFKDASDAFCEAVMQKVTLLNFSPSCGFSECCMGALCGSLIRYLISILLSEAFLQFERKVFARGDILAREGQPANNIIYISSGEAR